MRPPALLYPLEACVLYIARRRGGKVALPDDAVSCHCDNPGPPPCMRARCEA